jgi:outer membrane protein assembly factor BamA
LKFAQKIKKLFILSLFCCLIFWGCNVTRKIPPGYYLVDKVEIVNTKETKIEKSVFETFIRQKPNRKMFHSIDFFVWWYTKFDQEKISRKKAARNEKYDKKNEAKVKKYEEINAKREKKGKKPKTPKLKDKDSPIFLESIRDIGEAPVLLDSGMTQQTRQQLSKFLFSKGFFNNEVKDTIIVNEKEKKAVIKYILIPKTPYKVNKITYQMDDEKLGEILRKDSARSFITVGMNYDIEQVVKERQRLTNLALNQGYYFFENAYLNFDLDSGFANHTISVNVHLKKYSRAYSSSNDSLVLVNHPRYKIENIYVIPEPTPGNLQEVAFKDTLQGKRKDVYFLLNKPLSFRKSIFTTNIDIHRGQYFKKDTAEITYKALLGLGIFKSPSIKFFKNPDYSNRLDCYIICNPLLKQSLTAETEGINTSGNLGVDGSLVYQNRNIFKGGELFEIKLQGAFIAQQQFSDNKNTADITNIQKTFNTLQFGPEATFSVPRAFFPFSLFPFRKEMAPHTFVRTSLNYQSRSEFARVISDIDYGFNFNTNNMRLKHELIPLEVYLVDATLTQKFSDTLKSFHDAFLLNSFLDHITTLSKYSITYLSKENSNKSKKPVSYLKVSVASSGNILRAYNKQAGGKQDTLGRYLLFGIPFAQFIKATADFRIYIPIRAKSRVVYRVSGGIGKPQQNLNVLPYEQSFFAGGPNSIRAWRARTLGPGSYDPGESNSKYDKIGDILLEGNFEYRFHIIKSFNGAFFVDGGNIWRIANDPSKPGGQFAVDKFWDEIALGGGVGIRWDLDFFVLRFDFAAPLRDPKYPSGSRWTFDRQPWRQTVVNFGIGYPF